MFFDSHCHLTSDQLVPQFDNVLERAQQAKVNRVLNIADNFVSARAANEQVAVARGRGFKMWLTAGVHPHNADEYSFHSGDELQRLLDAPSCVAVGEIGLDYFYDETHPKHPGATREQQQKVFRAQIEIALERGLPVVMHNRDAGEDLLRVIGDYPNLRGVVHCFDASVEVAHRVLDLGLSLGFTGMVTFKNAGIVRDVAKICPLNRMLIETDAPYLAPVPFRGKTNEPAFVPRVAEAIATLRELSIDEIGAVTTDNARQLFRLD
jgi:TatD DNase family protein